MTVFRILRGRALLPFEGFRLLFKFHENAPSIGRLFCLFTKKTVDGTLLTRWKALRRGDGCLLIVTLCAVPFAKPSESTGRLPQLEDIDAGNLSHQSLLRNASSAAVTSASALVSQCLMTVNELNRMYVKEVYRLVQLYDKHNSVVGQQLGTLEDDIWQEIIHARVEVDERKRAMQEVENVLTSAVEALHATAEAAYRAGVEYSALEAKEKCQKTTEYLTLLQSETRKAESELRSIQARNIEKTSDKEVEDGNKR